MGWRYRNICTSSRVLECKLPTIYQMHARFLPVSFDLLWLQVWVRSGRVKGASRAPTIRPAPASPQSGVDSPGTLSTLHLYVLLFGPTERAATHCLCTAPTQNSTRPRGEASAPRTSRTGSTWTESEIAVVHGFECMFCSNIIYNNCLSDSKRNWVRGRQVAAPFSEPDCWKI